jgi:hypothetical protein
MLSRLIHLRKVILIMLGGFSGKFKPLKTSLPAPVGTNDIIHLKPRSAEEEEGFWSKRDEFLLCEF